MLSQRTLLLGGGLSGGGLLAAYRGDLTQFHFDAASAAGPALRLLDPESAHNLGLRAAAAGLFPRETRSDPPRLATTLWGRQFSNPFGELHARRPSSVLINVAVFCEAPASLVDGPAVWICVRRMGAGLAAGFDKNAEAVDGLLGLGLGFVEIGKHSCRSAWKCEGTFPLFDWDVK